MYTEREKVRFVERMWADGLRPTSAHRLWGSPTRDRLAAWEKQALAGELPAEPPPRAPGAEHTKHRPWPAATKAEALRLLGLGVPPRQVAARLGLPSGSVASAWARQAREAGGRARMGPEAVDMASGGGGGPAGDGELERAMLENAVLREMLRDPKAGDPGRLSNRRKAELVGRLRRGSGFPLRGLLTFLGMSRSSYEYERRALLRGPREPEGLRARVAHAFAASRGTYGYRRVMASIESGEDGLPGSRAPERAVRRIMREEGLVPSRRASARPYSSYGGEVDGDRPPNVPRERALARRASGEGFRLAHDFSAGRPGETLVSDVTEFSMGGWKCYLSPVLDCWDGDPVAWSRSRHPDSALCDSSLIAALSSLPAGHGPVTVHTDGGATYRSGSWKEACSAAGAARSMSRKGACGDNARAEGFFGTLKREFLNARDWTGVGYEEFAAELDGYIEWYRGGRLKAFREGGRTRYMTIADHRRLHGYAA